MSKKILVLFSLCSFLMACGTSPKEYQRKEAPVPKELFWQYEGLQRARIPGKVVRVWQKKSRESGKAHFTTLEILRGIDLGQFHIGFLIDKKELGILGFYEYDQRQTMDVEIQGQSYQALSFRRVNWDGQRDFIGFLNQGTSIIPSQIIYNGLKSDFSQFLVSLRYKSLAGEIKYFSFDLVNFHEERKAWLERVEKEEKI